IIRSPPGSGANLRALRSSRSARRNSSPSPASIERGFTPSTPAVRAPRFPRTRPQPTVKKAGSQTRLNRSSNRRSGPSVAHRCSLVWISSTRDRASARLGHGASVFTGDLLAFQKPPCQLAGSLRHAPCVHAPHAAALVSRGQRRRRSIAGALDVRRACRSEGELLVLRSRTRAAGTRSRTSRANVGSAVMSTLASLLQAYFTDRLLRQRHVSPNTVASYRDTFRLLLKFVKAKTGKAPSKISLEDLDAALIGAFLAHLETERGNSVRTRN